VDYEDDFDDEDYEEQYEPEEDGYDDEYDEQECDDMDENELADIMEEPNDFHAPQDQNQHQELEIQEQEEATFEQNEATFEQNEGAQETVVEDGETEVEDEDASYVPSDDEDMSLEADDEDGEGDANAGRTLRVRVPPQQHLQAKEEKLEEYSQESAHVIAMTMLHFNTALVGMNDDQACSFLQTYSLKQGIKKFGKRGKAAAHKEMKQLNDRVVFEPIALEDMTTLERKRAMESLIFLNEKRDGTIKARTCANGSTQRSYISRDEATSPTAASEAIITTGVIDAKQKRDVMTLDIPNAFVQTSIPQKGDKIIMKIRGQLADILLEICPGVYDKYVLKEGKQKVLYVRMLKALYGMLISSVLHCKKFRKDIETIGFEVNPYDICVANRMIKGKQQTVTWHVDDLKSSHVDPKVNDEFAEWCESMYGSEDLGHVKVVRGKTHDYLAMILDCTQVGALKIDMKYYIEGMIKEFPFPIKATKTTPWTEKLLKVHNDAKKLDEHRRALLHTHVMKAMFLCERARPDIDPAVAFLSARVKEANEGDWNKLLRMLGFLKGTIDEVLTLEADDTNTLTWYIDAAFAVHADMKSHTGAVFTLGKGAIISGSTKQKPNSRSSTEAELIGVDDKITKVLWARRFLEWQGFKVKLCIIYQDNTSTMKLEKNGMASSGKRTRFFDIKYFYVTDLISRDEVKVEHCPTDEMVADYMTKPVVGAKFKLFRDRIMNLSGKSHRIGQQECVGVKDNTAPNE
jgi:hypothetical protein